MTRARNSANLASHGNLFVDIANDRTGIGSVVPAQNLHVAGTAGFHADVTFTGDLYNTTWDRSANVLQFADSAQIKLGTGNDASLRHDGSNTWIQNTTGYLYIDAASSNGIRLISQSHWQAGAMAAFYPDGGVALYHDANLKFSTEAYGTNTTGTAVNDGLVVAGVATVTTMNVTGVLTYDDVTSVDSVGIVTAREGIVVPSSNKKIVVGPSGNLEIFYSSSHGSLLNTSDSGDIRFRIGGNTRATVSSNGLAVSGELSVGASLLITDAIKHTGDTNTQIRFPSDDTIRLDTGGSNRLLINSSGNATFSGDLTVSGNLSVTGTTTQNNTVSTTEKTITLASGAANNAAVDGAGIVVDAGSDTDKTLKWLDNTDRWTFTGGDVAANAFYGDGSNLTGIAADKIFEGNTEVEVVDTGSDGHVKITTEGTERIRINSNGQVGINTTVGGLVAVAVNSSNTNPLATGFIALTLKNTNTTDNTSVCMDFNNSVGGIVGRFGAQFTDTSDKDTDLYFATRQDGGSLSERLRIKSDGGMRLQKSDGNGNFTISRNASVTTTDQTIGVVDFASNTGHTVQARVMGKTRGTSNVGGDLVFEARANGGSLDERVRITGGGLVLIGRSASRMVGGSTTYAKLQVAGTSQSDSSISVVNNENSTAGAFLFFGKTRGNAVGSSTIVQNGDTLGGLSFIGADGNDTNNRTAEITAVVNGGPGNNEIPTDLTFSTSATHAGSLVERMRIYSSGRILIGNGASEGGPAGNLDIVGDINGDGGELYLRVSNNNSVDNIGALSFGNNVDRSVVSIKGHTHTANNTGDLSFHTSTTGTMSEKFRIHNTGDVSIGTVGAKLYTNNSGGNLTIQGGATYPGSAIKFNGGANGGTGHMHFYSGSSTSLEERMTLLNSGRILIGTTTDASAGATDTGYDSTGDLVLMSRGNNSNALTLVNPTSIAHNAALGTGCAGINFASRNYYTTHGKTGIHYQIIMGKGHTSYMDRGMLKFVPGYNGDQPYDGTNSTSDNTIQFTWYGGIKTRGVNFMVSAVYALSNASSLIGSGGRAQLQDKNARHYGPGTGTTNAFGFTDSRKRITFYKKGYVLLDFNQDFIGTTANGYCYWYVSKNGTNMGNQLIENSETSNEWSSINYQHAIPVSENDYLEVYFSGNHWTALDESDWSFYRFVWYNDPEHTSGT